MLAESAEEIAAGQRLSAFQRNSGRREYRPSPPLHIDTVKRAVAGIRYVHYVHTVLARDQGYTGPDPFADLGLRETLRGLKSKEAKGRSRRRHRYHHERKAGITFDQLNLIVAALDLGTLRGLRDRALLCMGYAGAFRRSELAALRMEQIDKGERRACARRDIGYIEGQPDR